MPVLKKSITQKPPFGRVRLNDDPINNKLMACWLFNEGKGPRVYDIANKHHGTFTRDGSGNTPKWVNIGKMGSSVTNFLNASCLIHVPYRSTLDFTNALSIETWIYPGNTAGWYDIVHRLNDAQNDDQFALFLSNTNNCSFLIKAVGSVHIQGIPPIINSWNHVVGTWDQKDQVLYQNGVETARGNQTGGIPGSSSPLTFGGDPAFGQNFQGKISLTRIWKRALQPYEVKTLYRDPYKGLTVSESPLGFVAAGGAAAPASSRRRIVISH